MEGPLTKPNTEWPPTEFNTEWVEFNTEGPPTKHNTKGPPIEFNSKWPPIESNKEVPPTDSNIKVPSTEPNTEGPPTEFNTKWPPTEFNTEGPPIEPNTEGPPTESSMEGSLTKSNTEGPLTESNKEESFKLRNQEFTYSDIENITDHFKKSIGRGGFGNVYLGTLKNGNKVAVKVHSPSSKQGSKEFRSEVQLLARTHHKNLVSFIGYCNDGTHMVLILEYMANENLEKHLSSDKSPKVLSWRSRLQIAIDTAQGLEYLHNSCDPPIIHRDMKTSNILLNERLQAKIADFGLSRDFKNVGDTHVSTVPAGTHGYIDPKSHTTGHLNEKTDVYSFGIVLFELITGRPAVIKGPEYIHITEWVRLQRGDIQSIVDQKLQGDFSTRSAWKAVTIATSCAIQSQNQRPDMSRVVAELKECLEIEMASKRTRGMVSRIKGIFELGASRSRKTGTLERDVKKSHDLQFFNFKSIASATDNFSTTNKVGEGGFGPVYKGILPDGQEVAIKKLSRNSGQGREEFKNELFSIAKLQHTNLVRLVGCCIEREEKIVIYEYMLNGSLDFLLFDPMGKNLLDWKKRFNIIEGVAQGLLYLHKYSRFRVIHRDLKAANILLDDEMNPKISDFGIARIFGRNESEANTNRIVGTRGYMAPEYAMEGIFSIKSDVFSFGVLLLEIVSGRKSTSYYHAEQPLNLIEHAWELWRQDRVLELMDPTLGDSYHNKEVLRCIHVGLLCVQDSPEARPTTSDVVSMISNETIPLSTPQIPTFYNRFLESESESTEHNSANLSINELSISEMEARS